MKLFREQEQVQTKISNRGRGKLRAPYTEQDNAPSQ